MINFVLKLSSVPSGGRKELIVITGLVSSKRDILAQNCVFRF